MKLMTDAALGVRLEYGELLLDGSNPTAIVTGLTNILAHGVRLAGTAAPGVSTSTLSSVASGGTINCYGWKPTSTSDTTLVASDGVEKIAWFAFGT